MSGPGTVYLVGAGPGDPGLLTCRGAELLRGCGALVYDRLGTEGLLELVPEGVERVYVGKRPGHKAATQDEIHQHLLRLASQGLEVVRLKGGDPFVFGRGSEEAQFLRQHGVPYEVVPGVTSGIAAPAYAGIPVTHRAVSVGVAFFTGHEDPAKPESQLNLESLARPGTTGVFYMGRRNLPRLCARLIELGRAPETPVALVEWGTYPRQRSVVGTLATAPEVADAAGIVPPCITVVGEVVALREEIAWFDTRPLSGRRVAVTRARAQASDLARRLAAQGAEVLEAPTIRVEDPEDGEALGAAAREVGGYSWLVVASANAVERFFRALREQGGDARRLGGVRVAAVGPATARALEDRGVVPDLVPEVYDGDAVVEALRGQVGEGDRVLLPRADIGRESLPRGLRELGAEVREVVAYRTVPAEVPEAVLEDFREGRVDAVTFTSSSTVKNFHEAVGRHVPGGYRVAAIGPRTAATLEQLGYTVDWLAAEASVPGLVQAVCDGLAG